jgi:hypothetical protein
MLIGISLIVVVKVILLISILYGDDGVDSL